MYVRVPIQSKFAKYLAKCHYFCWRHASISNWFFFYPENKLPIVNRYWDVVGATFLLDKKVFIFGWLPFDKFIQAKQSKSTKWKLIHGKYLSVERDTSQQAHLIKFTWTAKLSLMVSDKATKSGLYDFLFVKFCRWKQLEISPNIILKNDIERYYIFRGDNIPSSTDSFFIRLHLLKKSGTLHLAWWRLCKYSPISYPTGGVENCETKKLLYNWQHVSLKNIWSPYKM